MGYECVRVFFRKTLTTAEETTTAAASTPSSHYVRSFLIFDTYVFVLAKCLSDLYNTYNIGSLVLSFFLIEFFMADNLYLRSQNTNSMI